MKKKYTIKRALAGVLAAAQAFALAVWAAPETGAADFTLKSGFTDPSVTVSTMYYWKEGKPPIVVNRDGKTEGSTIGVEYPIIIAWDDRYYYSPSVGDIGTDINSPIARNSSEAINQDDNNYNQPDEDEYANGRPAGFLGPYRTYQNGIKLLSTTGIGQSLILNGVAASMDVPTNLYAVPTEEGRYALEVGKGSNKWIVSEHNFDCKKRGDAGYWNSLDWYLLVRDYNKDQWIDPNYNVPVRYAMHHNVPNYSGSEDFGLNRRTWTIYAQDDGQYSIGTYGTARWDVEDWSSVGDGKHEWRDTAKQYVDGLIWSYTDTYISHNLGWKKNGGGAEGIQSFGDWKRDSFGFSQAANKSEYKFRVFYGEPNTVSFLQTDTKVQNGQVVNLDGPIVIGKSATVTVEDGGVLVVSGWVMNGGYILVKPGGMLIVQDQERLDGTHQYGVISPYEEKAASKGGRISCDGIMIVNRDCKVIGGGLYGLQFGEGAQCVNYGQLISENFEVYGDHTIENRGDVSAVYAGWGLKGGSFAMANKRIAMGASFNGQGTIESTSSVRMARNAVYGPGAVIHINFDDKVKKQFDMDNRKGHVSDVEPYTTTYTPKVDNANGLLYVTDGQNNRYDWYESLNAFARFTFENGTWKRYDFSGYCTMPAGMAILTGGPGVASYSPQRNNFFITSGGKTYWYNATQAGGSFLDEDALTDAYYPGTAKFPPSAVGASLGGNVIKPQNAGPQAIDLDKSYYIVPVVDDELMLDSVHWWKSGIGIGLDSRLRNTGSSKWKFEKEAAKDGSTQYIIRGQSGYCLEAFTDSGTGEEVVRAFNGSSNSTDVRWRLIPDGDGYVIASATNPDYVLDVPAEKIAKGNVRGEAIQLYQKNGSRNQRWKLIPTDQLVDGGIYYIQTPMDEYWKGRTMVAEVAGYSKDDGANVQIWQWHGGNNQRWEARFEGTEIIDGHTIYFYRFINVNSGKALSIDGTTYQNHTNVAQYTAKADGDHQIWGLIPDRDGFKIIAKSTIRLREPQQMVLQLRGGYADGIDITLWNIYPNDTRQRWIFYRLK